MDGLGINMYHSMERLQDRRPLSSRESSDHLQTGVLESGRNFRIQCFPSELFLIKEVVVSARLVQCSISLHRAVPCLGVVPSEVDQVSAPFFRCHALGCAGMEVKACRVMSMLYDHARPSLRLELTEVTPVCRLL